MPLEPWNDQQTPAREILTRGNQILQDAPARFTVQSQSRPGNSYAVVVETQRQACQCAFQVESGRACIHILAVRYWLEIQTNATKGTTTERVRLTYKQAWSAYNAAQASEVRLFDQLLSDLVQEVPEPAYQGNGRPALPMKEQVFCAVQKVYSQLSCRRASSLFGFASERGQLCHVPHYNVSSTFLNRPDATPILRGLVRLTAAPLAGVETNFAIDSTGFRTRSFGAYCAEKHGQKKEHKWLKAHLATGVNTNIVTDVIVTGSDGEGSGDSPNFAPLVQGTVEAGFQIEEVSADKAYSSRDNHDAVGAVGGQAYIPFKSNAKGRAHGSPLWRKAFLFFQLHEDEFKARYHKRSNVESTIGAIKKKLGETLKSKNRVAQEHELLCKVLAYNITVLIHEMFENGISPDFLGTRKDGNQ